MTWRNDDMRRKGPAMAHSLARQRSAAVDDTPLIERIRAGEQAALTALYRRHGSSVYWSAFNVLRSRSDSEEAAADAFLTLWQRREEVQIYGESALPWLVVTAKNHARNLLRANERRTTSSLEAVTEQADPGATPIAAAELAEAMRQVASIVQRLPDVDQAIFRLCMVDELSYKEAASALGIGHGSVRNRLSRLRARLKRELGFQIEGRAS